MSITDLCGSLKSFSDLKRHPVKVRWTESTELKAGAFFRMTLSRHSDANGPWFLDCRKVFLRFKFKITEASNSGITQFNWIDSPTAAVCVRPNQNRVRLNGHRRYSESLAFGHYAGKHPSLEYDRIFGLTVTERTRHTRATEELGEK